MANTYYSVAYSYFEKVIKQTKRNKEKRFLIKKDLIDIPFSKNNFYQYNQENRALEDLSKKYNLIYADGRSLSKSQRKKYKVHPLTNIYMFPEKTKVELRDEIIDDVLRKN